MKLPDDSIEEHARRGEQSMKRLAAEQVDRACADWEALMNSDAHPKTGSDLAALFLYHQAMVAIISGAMVRMGLDPDTVVVLGMDCLNAMARKVGKKP